MSLEGPQVGEGSQLPVLLGDQEYIAVKAWSVSCEWVTLSIASSLSNESITSRKAWLSEERLLTRSSSPRW